MESLHILALGVLQVRAVVPDYPIRNDALEVVANLPSVGEMTDAEVFAIRICFSYVRGLDDGMGVLRTPFCEPYVTNAQLMQILLKYIRDNPEKAHLRTAVLYLAAMEKAFPCTKK
jgi:hypothetical protein